MREEGLLVVTGVSSDYSRGTVVEGIVGRGLLAVGAVACHNRKNFSVGWIDNGEGRQRSALAGEKVSVQLSNATKFDFRKGDELEFKS